MIEAAASDAAVTRGSIGCILMILSYPLSKLVLRRRVKGGVDEVVGDHTSTDHRAKQARQSALQEITRPKTPGVPFRLLHPSLT